MYDYVYVYIYTCVYTGGVKDESVLAFGYLPEPSPKLLKELGGLRAPTMVTYNVYIYYVCIIVYLYTMYAL